MTPEDVLAEYHQLQTIRATAQKLGVSHCVVRKVLIGAGIIDSPLTRSIADLRASGLSDNAIAEALGISPSWVNANTPYSRGTYLAPNKSHNAMLIKRHRHNKALNATKPQP